MNATDLEQNFFGRNSTLELLKKRVLNLKEGYRQNVALLGNQYLGKSALLGHFLANLDEDKVTVVYLDLEQKDFRYFLSKFIGSLLYNYSKNKDLPLHDDVNLLVQSTQKYIPQTIEVINKIRLDFEHGRTSESFLGLLALPEIFTNETKHFCVLILDEFQNLEELLVANAFRHLGKKIMTQKRCLYIMSSSYPELAQKILSEKLSLLFGNFEIVNVEAFDFCSAQDFIDFNLKDIKIGVQLRNFLIDFTGGHPLYLNLVCQELLNLSAIYKQSEIYMPLLSQSVENTLFNRWGVISRHFDLIINELCSGKGNRAISLILISLSNGKNKLEDLMGDVGLKRNQMTQKINRLLELGILTKNGNVLYLKDKLFKYWIKFVYQRRVKDIEFAFDKQQKQFKEEFHRCVEHFNVTSRKDFSSRIVDLFNCFDNEAFDLNGRKYKLPVFCNIVPFKFKNESGNYVDVIKASTKNSDWYVVLKKDNIGESDVHEICAQSRQIGRKPERCVLISLLEIDDNIRLKAYQERFWVWNEGELNILLKLFNQPYIVR